jgi:hypothetical protein
MSNIAILKISKEYKNWDFLVIIICETLVETHQLSFANLITSFNKRIGLKI